MKKNLKKLSVSELVNFCGNTLCEKCPLHGKICYAGDVKSIVYQFTSAVDNLDEEIEVELDTTKGE